jgi:hypothetical protein
MSQFTFIQGLLEEADDQAILESSTMALTRSSFFKTIQSKKPDLADALEGFWGRLDFPEFAMATLDSVKLKKGKWKDIDKTVQEALDKLIQLHNKMFPEIAKKAVKLPTNYNKVQSSNSGSAAHGRAAERDWVNNM